MNAILAKLGIIAAVFAIGALAGWTIQDWHIESQRNAALVKQIDAERAEVKRLNQLSFEVGQELGKQAAARADAARKAKATIDYWRKKGTINVQCPGSEGAQAVSNDAVRFDADFVGVWNRGLCLALSEGARAGCTAAGGPVGGSAATGPITPADLADNQQENARRWGQCLDQVRGWKAWAEGRGLKP